MHVYTHIYIDTYIYTHTQNAEKYLVCSKKRKHYKKSFCVFGFHVFRFGKVMKFNPVTRSNNNNNNKYE